MAKKNASLQWIYRYSKKHIWAVLSLTLINALSALVYIGLALLSKDVIDIATAKQEGDILLYCILFVGVIAFQACLYILNNNIQVRTTGKIGMEIKQSVFDSLLEKQLKELNRFHSGEHINRLTSDIDIVVNGIVTIVPQAVSMAVKLIAGFAVLVSIDVRYSVIVLVCGAVVFLISWLYRGKFMELHKTVQQTDGRTRSFIQECMENIVVIKTFTSEIPIINRLIALQKENYDAKILRNKISVLANTGVFILFSGGYYFTLIWGAMQVASGSMTFGSLTAFLQIFNQLSVPFKNISGLIPQYLSTIASSERLQELENLSDEVPINVSIDVAHIYEKMVSIEFENVYFAYDQKVVFEDASTTIKKGEFVAIVGNSGAGKSTLAKLLLGLIAADSGEIYIKTRETKYKIDASLRKMFSYVPQGNMVLSGTIRENITFFNYTIADHDVVEAAQIACVMDFVSELPQGLDTVIGEHGIGLSEGQILRIAIARALLSKAPILLLDEATSALDRVTERKMVDNLKALQSKTCIFISHREYAIIACDRVIKIENNRMFGECKHGFE